MKNLTRILFALIIVLSAFGNKKPAYLIYESGKDKDVSWEKLLKSAGEADVIFFGELHNNPICHWLELELTKAMYNEVEDKLILAAEMFEADDQVILNEYMRGLIREKSFKKEAKIWPNYKTDYAPLVEFAKKKKISFIATNIPRRYASLVSREGLESLDDLSEEAKSWIAPLPIDVDLELPGYKNMSEMMADMHDTEPDSVKSIVYAQAVKDATMGWFISENLEKGSKLLHFNGAYHSNDHEGTVYYLKKYKPGIKILTISTVEQTDVTQIEDEHSTLADFILVVPDNMTKTY